MVGEGEVRVQRRPRGASLMELAVDLEGTGVLWVDVR